ncbi:unnamed protein product, partial [Sphacelaria rigidula]
HCGNRGSNEGSASSPVLRGTSAKPTAFGSCGFPEASTPIAADADGVCRSDGGSLATNLRGAELAACQQSTKEGLGSPSNASNIPHPVRSISACSPPVSPTV